MKRQEKVPITYTKIPLHNPHYHAYLFETSLLIFSETSERVYGLEKESAALFLTLDERLQTQSPQSLLEAFDPLGDTAFTALLELAQGKEDERPLAYGPQLDLGTYVPDALPRYRYVAADVTFAVHYPEKALFNAIHPVLAHLEAFFPTKHRIAVDFTQDEGLWQLHFNGSKVAVPAPVRRLAPIVQENMLLARVQADPYLITLHAAVVGYGDALFVLPAVSGSGKSTLTAALVGAGFTLYSDELCALGTDGKAMPIPFALNIKEGSWPVLQPYFPELASLHEHDRFDAQRVRFLPPKNLAAASKAPTHILFPKYRPHAATSLVPQSPCETLNTIKESGYQVYEPLNAARFSRLLDALLVLPAYAFEYSELADAIETIKRLARADS